MAEKGVFEGKGIRKLKRRKAKAGYLTVVDYTLVLFSFCDYTYIFFSLVEFFAILLLSVGSYSTC